MPLRTSMMITIAAIEATAIAMMTMTLAIIAGLGDKIVLSGCDSKLQKATTTFQINICIFIISWKPGHATVNLVLSNDIHVPMTLSLHLACFPSHVAEPPNSLPSLLFLLFVLNNTTK